MNVGDICVHDVVTVLEHDELTAAARMMREQHVGYLVVVKQKVGETGFLLDVAASMRTEVRMEKALRA